MKARWPLTGATALYGMWLLIWIHPDPWMWRVWAIVAAILSAIVVTLVLMARPRAPGQSLVKMVPAITATLVFAVVAVLAAVLETRDPSGITAKYWALGVGMMLVVALYLNSYDRRSQS